jgi:hypothetical protein
LLREEAGLSLSFFIYLSAKWIFLGRQGDMPKISGSTWRAAFAGVLCRFVTLPALLRRLLSASRGPLNRALKKTGLARKFGAGHQESRIFLENVLYSFIVSSTPSTPHPFAAGSCAVFCETQENDRIRKEGWNSVAKSLDFFEKMRLRNDPCQGALV